MAATQVLAPQTAAANSTPDTVVAAGGSVNFGLKTGANGSIPWDADIVITRKGDDGFYYATGVLLNAVTPNAVITGEGSYRVEKPVTRNAIGVFVG